MKEERVSRGKKIKKICKRKGQSQEDKEDMQEERVELGRQRRYERGKGRSKKIEKNERGKGRARCRKIKKILNKKERKVA